MDVVNIALVLSVLMVGCMGSDPEEAYSKPENKQKIFDIFNKTFSYEGEHSRRMKNQWNEENPLHKETDHKKIYKHAWSIIDEKCKECERQTGVNQRLTRIMLSQIHQEIAGTNPEDRRLMHKRLLNDHREFRNLSRDLTWSLVHDWHRYYAKDVVPYRMKDWTGEMKASLLYIRDQVRREGVETRNEIRTRWIMLYPQYRLKSTSLEFNLRSLDESKYQPTTDDKWMARVKYDSLFRPKKKEENTRSSKWTPQMVTDLLYIATRLNPRDRLFNQKLKRRWDQMNDLYSHMSEKNLVSRLYRVRVKDDFQLRPIHVRRAEMKYKKITQIDERSIVYNPLFETEFIKFIDKYKNILDKFIENMDPHEVSDHETGSSPSSPQHFHGKHSSEEETSPPHEYQQPEFMRNLSAPIHSPSFLPEFEYLPKYSMHHYPNMSGYDVGASSSTPHPTHGGHLPEGGISAHDEYQRPEFTQNLSAPIYSPPSFPEFGYPDYDMHHYPNLTGYDVGASSSTPHPTHSGPSPGGGTSASHRHYQPELTQNMSAPIYSPPLFTEFGYSPDYAIHHYPNVSGHDVGASSSTPHSTHGGHPPGGETSAPHEYQQTGFLQDPNASIHPPRSPTEVRSPLRYSTQTPPPKLAFNSPSHTLRRRREEGSSTPRARRRQLQE